MAANPKANGTALLRDLQRRLSYEDRLERLKTLPEDRWTSGDKAVKLVEDRLEQIVKDLVRMSAQNSPTAAKTLLEMSGLYQPGLKLSGDVQHSHQHRVVNITLSERIPQQLTQAQASAHAGELSEPLVLPEAQEAEYSEVASDEAS